KSLLGHKPQRELSRSWWQLFSREQGVVLQYSPSLQQHLLRDNSLSSRLPISLLLCRNTPWFGMTSWGKSVLRQDGRLKSAKAEALPYASILTTGMQEASSC